MKQATSGSINSPYKFVVFAIALPLLVILALGLWGYRHYDRVHLHAQSLAAVHLPGVVDLAQLRADVLELHNLALTRLARRGQNLAAVDQRHKQVADEDGALIARLRGTTSSPAHQRLLARVESSYAAYRKALEDGFELERRGNADGVYGHLVSVADPAMQACVDAIKACLAHHASTVHEDVHGAVQAL